VAPLRPLVEQTQVGFLARTSYREHVRGRLVQEAMLHRPIRPSVAELETPILDQIAAYAAEHKALLIVGWSEETASYSWLQTWAAANDIRFADWATRARSIRAAIPTLPVHNQHSGGHHRGWVNQVIAREFARQIRARR